MVETVNMHEAKTRLSQLVAAAVNGHPFIIARAGKPLVKVEALDALEAPPKSRVGFLKDFPPPPEDFDTMFQEEIEAMFNGDE